MNDKVICISQARMTSSRLPGKILREVCGRSLLDYHVSRLRASQEIDILIIATTVNSTDDVIENYCTEKNVGCVRGCEDDVLSRYYQAMKGQNADIIVRVTSDCPLIDPMLVDHLITYFKAHRDQYDYVTFGRENFPRGLDAEVFSREALESAYHLGQEDFQREHVTPYIYRDKSQFRCGIYPSQDVSGHHRWCVDEPRDFELIEKMLSALDGTDDFTWQDCRALFDVNPEWFDINSAVNQKKLGE